jgi:hypothetical protein
MPGTYTDTLTNEAGCDSVITYQLGIITVDTSVTWDGSAMTSGAADADYQWFECGDGYSPIEGETGQSFAPLDSGSYAVEVTIDGCTDTSKCLETGPLVSFEQVRPLGTVRAWQGPEDVIFVYPGDLNGKMDVRVSDICGRIVHRELLNRTSAFTLELKAPPGIYFIYLDTGRKQEVLKFLKR